MDDYQNGQQGEANYVGVDGFFSQKEAMDHLAKSRTSLWKLMKSGEIKAKKDGSKVLICRRSVRDYIENLPEYTEVNN